MKNKHKVILVGPLPPPIGGVSSHIIRLSTFLLANDFRCTVLDGYPEESKVNLPGVDHIVFSGRLRWFAMLRFLCTAESRDCDVIHLHFSTIIGKFILFSLLIVKFRRKILLTFHNGAQLAVFKQASWPLKILSFFALRRMDKIVALSNQQLTFYQSLNIKPEHLVRWEVAIPVNVVPDSTLLPSEVQNIRPIEMEGEETILMTSGYPNLSYGYNDCVELLDKISAHLPCRLIVSLYGTGNDPLYEKRLRAMLLEHPKVVLVGPLSAAGFAALLLKASLYIRPSMVDSYGLAITDALDLGVSCLASDVCTRDPRCETFPVGDKDAFLRKAQDLIERGRRLRARKNYRPIDISYVDAILNCYY